jgi:hypothetical protein
VTTFEQLAPVPLVHTPLVHVPPSHEPHVAPMVPHEAGDCDA